MILPLKYLGKLCVLVIMFLVNSQSNDPIHKLYYKMNNCSKIPLLWVLHISFIDSHSLLQAPEVSLHLSLKEAKDLRPKTVKGEICHCCYLLLVEYRTRIPITWYQFLFMTDWYVSFIFLSLEIIIFWDCMYLIYSFKLGVEYW